MKKISEIEDFHSLDTITVREKGSDSLGSKFDTVYKYSFLTRKVSSVDIKQNKINKSKKVRILFDTTPDDVERILAENGISSGYEIVDEESSIIAEKSISDQIVSSLMKAGEYAAIELEEDDETNWPVSNRIGKCI